MPNATPVATITENNKIIHFDIPGKVKSVNESNGGQVQAKLFLKRLSNISTKLNKEMELIKISRGGDYSDAPKGGKKLLREERKRSEDQSTNDPSRTYLNAINSKSSINAVTA